MTTGRLNIESKIRDWLADHLDFIIPGLKLIQKEFYLPDEIGARGFVDLLCEDAYHNFVVIEIKRSDASARQTISEVLKYHSLIKHNFSARESELRTIVISTHWNELIRPFSETVHRTTLDLTGYEITLDVNSLPNGVSKIEPLENTLMARRFSYWYGMYLFELDQQRNAFFKDFEAYLLSKEFKDFVLVKVVGDLTDERVIYPYGAVVAFQEKTLTELPEVIKLLNEEEYQYLQEPDEFDDELEYRRYLEGELINVLDKQGYDYSAEACYPQMVNSMHQSEKWRFEQIQRHGIFSRDPRYSDELLISELSGLDRNSENGFFGISESTQVEKMKEIRANCRYSLQQSPVWLETIDAILDELESSKKKFRLTLQIYNPDSLMVAIYHTATKKDLNYLPFYFMSVDYLNNDLSEIYHGSVKWNGNFPESALLKPFAVGDDHSSLIFDLFYQPDNVKDALEMSLGYTTSKYKIVGKDANFQGFLEVENGKLVSQGEFLFSFAQFAVTYQAQLADYLNNFERSYVEMK
jgi:hypothetical protein